MSAELPVLTDKELLYAATVRCKCGAGMAYPLDHGLAQTFRAWGCSRVLKGEGTDGGHDNLPFMFWKVREETSINNIGGFTTRPSGTVMRTVGKATCPKCHHAWQSEPYVACGAGHHWFSGPCPSCGYAVGGAGSWSTSEGTPIEKRYTDVVLEDPQ